MNTKFNGVIQAVAAFFFWSTLGVFFNRVRLPSTVYVAFGSLVALSGLYLYYFIKKKQLPVFKFSWWLLILFLVAAVKGVVWFKALSLYPIAKAMLIHNLAPVVALILSPVLIKEKFHINHVIAVITGFIGLFLILQPDVNQNILLTTGAIFSLIAALASGLQDVAQRKLSDILPGLNQAFIFVLGQALGSILFLYSGNSAVGWPDLTQIIYFGIIGTALPIILLSNSFKSLKAFEVATLGYTEPLLGAIWGSLFLSQNISVTLILGGLLIFLSGVTVIRNHSNLSMSK